MNALELANELNNGKYEDILLISFEAATMLRQQQAEIEALKSDGKVCARCGAIAYDPVITYPAKPTKVKFASNSCESGWIYLDYEEPAKTLTDEEIEQVRVAIMGTAYWCVDENMSEAYNAVKVCCGQVLAILRKAQEK